MGGVNMAFTKASAEEKKHLSLTAIAVTPVFVL